MKTVWITEFYDPTAKPVELQPAETPHHHVLNCLYGDMNRIDEIAVMLKRSRSYINEAILDLIEVGAVNKVRLPGWGNRALYLPSAMEQA